MLPNIDLQYLRSVQNLSLKKLGLTKKNPSVACLIVDFNNDIRGKVVSYGLTSVNGKPHAEVNALKKITNKLQVKHLTIYISLEPCFKKKIDSCSSFIVKSGIKRVVIDSLDPNPEIFKKGYLLLKKNKIKVLFSEHFSKFSEFNKYFYIYKKKERPFITLKLAISKNNYTKDYDSADITSKETQRYLHYLRLRHDAICVGYKTFIEDNPKLTCRLQGINKKLKRVVIFKNNLKKIKIHKGFNFIEYKQNSEFKYNLYEDLAKLKIKSLLVEGGLSTFMLFFKTGLYDEIIISTSDNNVLSSEVKYKIKYSIFNNLIKYSHNNYGKDQIIVYKNK